MLIPLIVMGVARRQVAIRNQYDQDGNQRNDENNNNNQYYNNNCKWYQWNCNNNYNNYDENGQQQQQQEEDEFRAPWWWFWGDNEEARRRRDEMNQASPALIFTYVWTLVLFLVLLYFGYRETRNGSDLFRVTTALVVFANLCFIVMILLGGLEGGVQTEGRELEEQGFYGQFGVMMFLTLLFWMIWSCVYAGIFTWQAKRSNQTVIEVDETDYKIHQPEQEMATTSTTVATSSTGLVAPAKDVV